MRWVCVYFIAVSWVAQYYVNALLHSIDMLHFDV